MKRTSCGCKRRCGLGQLRFGMCGGRSTQPTSSPSICPVEKRSISCWDFSGANTGAAEQKRHRYCALMTATADRAVTRPTMIHCLRSRRLVPTSSTMNPDFRIDTPRMKLVSCSLSLRQQMRRTIARIGYPKKSGGMMTMDEDRHCGGDQRQVRQRQRQRPLRRRCQRGRERPRAPDKAEFGK